MRDLSLKFELLFRSRGPTIKAAVHSGNAFRAASASISICHRPMGVVCMRAHYIKIMEKCAGENRKCIFPAHWLREITLVCTQKHYAEGAAASSAAIMEHGRVIFCCSLNELFFLCALTRAPISVTCWVHAPVLSQSI